MTGTETQGGPGIALVTGANKGIGLEIARGLAAAGLQVVLGCRDPGRGQAAAEAVSAEGRPVGFLTLDVADDASIAAAMATLDERYGRLDVLVNNAGVSLDRQTGAKGLRAVMSATYDVNVFGLACMIEASLPLLTRSARPRIVNLSSGLGSLTQASDPAYEFAPFKFTAYNSSKAAVTMLTILFAAKLRESGIKVNAADPGFCMTDINDGHGERTAEQGAAVAIRLAMLDDDGPTGGFFDHRGTVPW